MASLAHLNGIVIGFIFIKTYPWLRSKLTGDGQKKDKASKKANNLRLVVDNTQEPKSEKPKYWN